MYLNQKLEQKLIEHEGIKKSAYQDSEGFWTIGCGRLIDAKRNAGLSVAEVMYLLRNDIERIYNELCDYTWFKQQNDVRQGVIMELAFNIGIQGLLGFEKMIEALTESQSVVAAKEMLNSKWATQVSPKRVSDMVQRMRTGRYNV